MFKYNKLLNKLLVTLLLSGGGLLGLNSSMAYDNAYVEVDNLTSTTLTTYLEDSDNVENPQHYDGMNFPVTHPNTPGTTLVIPPSGPENKWTLKLYIGANGQKPDDITFSGHVCTSKKICSPLTDIASSENVYAIDGHITGGNYNGCVSIAQKPSGALIADPCNPS